MTQYSTLGDAAWMGRFSLMVLLVQNYSQFLLMKLSRESGADEYSTGAAVLFQEIIKLVLSLGLVFWLECGASLNKAIATLREHIVEQPMEFMKIAVPGLVYTLQVLYQAKILTTAVFSVTMLGRTLSAIQWGCLVLLTAGVALVQLGNIEADALERATKDGIPAELEAGDASAGLPDTPEGIGEDATRAAYEARQEAHAGVSSLGGESADDEGDMTGTMGLSRQWVGFLAVMAATTLSGFAGVYFEKVIKGGKTGLWTRNVQLALFGILFGTCGILFRPEEFRMVTERGLLAGFTPLVWGVVMDISIGGLAVAMVVKYASSVAKGFSISMSVLLSALTAAVRRGGMPSGKFAAGTLFVLAATVGFSYFQPPPLPKAQAGNGATSTEMVEGGSKGAGKSRGGGGNSGGASAGVDVGDRVRRQGGSLEEGEEGEDEGLLERKADR